MKNFLKISLIILIFAVLTSPLWIKLKNIDEKIKLTQISFDYPNSFENVKNIFTDYFYTTVKITLSNYSDIPITINQANVNLYTLKDSLFLEQNEPLNEKIKIAPNTNTTIELNYQVYYTDIVELVEDNNLLKNPVILFKDLIKYQTLNTEVKAKGTIEVQGITIAIDEKFEI